MIQRIQTVYLILGVAAVASTFFTGGLTAVAHSGDAWFMPTAASAIGLASALGVVAVFLYGDRKRQRGLILLTQYLTLALLVLLLVGMQGAGYLPRIQNAEASSWLTIVMPLAGYVFFLLARRGVEADIKLIESVDRLR